MNNNDNIAKYVDFFRQSSPYIHAHRGKTFVITLSGYTLAHENLDNIISDIALMSSLGVRLVIVYGARPQIESRLSQQGLQTSFHKGLRITDKKSLECIKDAVGNLQALIESKLSIGVTNSPMYGSRLRVLSGNFISAKPVGVLAGIDFQCTGNIRRIDTKALTQLLDSGFVTLISCLGHSPTGEVFNLSVEDVASQVATSLSAQKLVLYGQEKGVLNSKGHYINRLQPEKAQGLLPYQTEEGKRLLRAAIQACYNGVERSQIISYSEDGSLLVELFTRDGSGTLVYQDHYEEIRSARIDDISGIIELIRPLEEQGVLRRRSRKELEAEIHLFSVVLLDGMIIGCAALHPVPVGDPKTCFAELACVVVHPNYRQGHRGEHLLQHAEQQAKTQNIKTLFVMTTQTSHWFQERGFEVSSEESLPEDIRKKYDPKRASKVLTKQL